MDLSGLLLRHTPPRPLLVAVPGGAPTMAAVERAVRERGWRRALSPAEANLLVVAGAAGADLEPYVHRVWGLVPAPKVRVDVIAANEADARLDAALRLLRDPAHQRETARLPVPDAHRAAAEPGDHAAHHAGPAGHEDHASHHDSHAGHGGHDMGGMAMPGGIPMADRAADRDGLALDQLHVPLGPVLPHWPAGLIVHTRLQGDVVQDATVEVLGGAGPVIGHPGARRLDSCARLLAVAGWDDASVAAQRLRDSLLAGGDPPVDRWARRVRRSRTLRWLLIGVGVVEGGPPALAGDALDRLHRWLDPTSPPPAPDESQWTVDHLPALLAGVEVATARLVVASLDPDLARVAGHG